MPMIALAIAAAIGLLAPLPLMFTDACDYLECRKEMAPFALGVTYFGVGLTLIVAWVMIASTAPRGRHRTIALIALIGVFVSSFLGWKVVNYGLFDDRPVLGRESREIKNVLGRMPGVHQVSTATDQMFSTVVVLTDEASLAQAKAVIQTFRETTAATPDFERWEYDIEVRQGVAASSFTTGKAGLLSAPDQVALWFALRDAFPRDEVKWTYHTWAHYSYGSSDQFRRRDTAVGGISLKLANANGPTAVSEAYRRLMRDFPDFAEALWDIGPARQGSGFLILNNRYPTESELSVWDRLNEDQQIPHNVLMMPDPTGWKDTLLVIQQPESHQLNDAELLAQKHLPIIAELGRVNYTATAISTDFDRDNTWVFRSPGNSLHIAIFGGCTRRTYTPSAIEQQLADRYEYCR